MYPQLPKLDVFSLPNMAPVAPDRCIYTQNFTPCPVMHKYFENRWRMAAINKLAQSAAGTSSQNSYQSGPSAPPAEDPNLFYCNCRDCRLYFRSGGPIECVDPYDVLESHYPKWNFTDAMPEKRVGGIRRPAGDDTSPVEVERGGKRRKL